MTWNVGETRMLIEKAFGRDQLLLARPCLKSVIDRQDHARYHYQEAIALLDAFKQKYLSVRPLLDVVFAKERQDRLAFDTLMTKIGANTIACIQSIHSIADILAHVMYFALGINRANAMKERAVSVNSVYMRLMADERFTELGKALHALATEGQAAHLCALANYGKHRSIVEPLMSEDCTGLRLEKHEVRISSFKYQGAVYPEIAVEQLLEPEYARCSTITVVAGERLNRVLSTFVP